MKDRRFSQQQLRRLGGLPSEVRKTIEAAMYVAREQWLKDAASNGIGSGIQETVAEQFRRQAQEAEKIIDAMEEIGLEALS